MFKRMLSLLAALALAGALALPALAEDVPAGDGATATPPPVTDNGGSGGTTTSSDGVYIVGYTVTDPAGGEIATVDVGDRVNIILQVVDHSSARYNVEPQEIATRINSSVFTYTGTGEIGQLFESNDDPDTARLQRVRNGEASEAEKQANAYYNYYSYVLLFRDVIYNGGGNTLPINLTYLDTSKPMQQFSVQIGQCVDKDQTTSPNLVVRSTSYGSGAIAGEAFTLSLGVYATRQRGPQRRHRQPDAARARLAVQRQPLVLPGFAAARDHADRQFSRYMPASGFTGTVANITVNLAGTGAVSGKAVTGTTAISVPVSQPDRFEVGQLEVSDTLYLGDTRHRQA